MKSDTYICKHCGKITPKGDLNSKGWKVCQECLRKYQKEYRSKNKEQMKIANAELISERAKVNWQKNGSKYNAKGYQRKKRRLATDIAFRLQETLRARISMAVKSNAKTGSAVKLLGCSVPEFKLYLESKWLPGMTWNNWKLDGWHIDHIRPISSFDLTNPSQMAEACIYTNMQPLWAKDNLDKRKSDRNKY